MSAVEAILLSAWLGAAVVVAAVVAPAAFKVLPTRALAGALVGEVLPVIFVSGLVVAAVAGWMEARAGEPRRWATTVPIAVMIAACIVAQFVIGPKIEAVRAGIGGAVDALPATDARRIEFGRLHAYSVLSMGVGMLGAGAALLMKLFSKSS